MSKNFRILCGNDPNQAVEVSAEKAKKKLEKSDYFRAMFEHGTCETDSKIIRTPTWTKTTAEHVVELLSSSRTRPTSLLDTKNLLMASNEILLQTRIFIQDSSEVIISIDESLWSSPHRWSFENLKMEMFDIIDIAKNENIMLFPFGGIQVSLDEEEKFGDVQVSLDEQEKKSCATQPSMASILLEDFFKDLLVTRNEDFQIYCPL